MAKDLYSFGIHWTIVNYIWRYVGRQSFKAHSLMVHRCVGGSSGSDQENTRAQRSCGHSRGCDANWIIIPCSSTWLGIQYVND